MPQDRRDELLKHLLSSNGSAALGDGWDPAMLSRIVTGLLFAQRPISAAGNAVTERFKLGPRSAYILSLIDRGVEYPKDLALVLRIGRSLMTAELTRLAEAGLIAAQAGADRRHSLLRLTPLGMQVTGAFRDRVSELLQSRLKSYTREQVELFADMLLHIQEEGPR